MAQAMLGARHGHSKAATWMEPGLGGSAVPAVSVSLKNGVTGDTDYQEG